MIAAQTLMEKLPHDVDTQHLDLQKTRRIFAHGFIISFYRLYLHASYSFPSINHSINAVLTFEAWSFQNALAFLVRIIIC